MQYQNEDIEKLPRFLYPAATALLELIPDESTVMMNAYASRCLMPISASGRSTTPFEMIRPFAPGIESEAAECAAGRGPIHRR